MSDHPSADDPTWAPSECALPTTDRPLRRAEFDDLFAVALDVDRLTDRHVRLRLSGSTDLVDRVQDLTARETECCTFFTFAMTADPVGRVFLDIEVPAAHIAVLDALVGRATQLGASR